MGSENPRVRRESYPFLRILYVLLADLGALWLPLHWWFHTAAETFPAKEDLARAERDHATLARSEVYAWLLHAAREDPRYVLSEEGLGPEEFRIVHAAVLDARDRPLPADRLGAPEASRVRLYLRSRFRPFRMAYTYDARDHEITRSHPPAVRWQRELPELLW